jgi:hypothetical protein
LFRQSGHLFIITRIHPAFPGEKDYTQSRGLHLPAGAAAFPVLHIGISYYLIFKTFY